MIGVLLIGGIIGTGVTYVVDRHTSSRPTAQAPPTTTSTSMAQGTAPLQVLTETPSNGTKNISASTTIAITFSAPLATTSPVPTLVPATPGTWSRSGATLTFTPTTRFTPLTTVTLTVPSGTSGVTSTAGNHLAQPGTDAFQIANGSIVRLQQLLALLNYSPLMWTPSGTSIAATDEGGQIDALYDPPAGTYAWRNSGWPARLRTMWRPGDDNVFTRGLVMSFQADHGLDPNGTIGASLWTDLVSALATSTLNTGGYNYALADKKAPESLTIYHDGAVVLKSPANTGVAAAPTPDGTFPVNTRLRRQVMRGTNTNGQKYADLVQYIAYFNGNDAVHYMNRGDYGIPQSLGCVELPLTDAAKAWPYLAYGTLVTVIH